MPCQGALLLFVFVIPLAVCQILAQQLTSTELIKPVSRTTEATRSNATAFAWSAWGVWSKCSRTCGGGVAVQERQCLPRNPSRMRRSRKRRKLMKSTERLRRTRAILSGDPDCPGLARRYHECNTEPCPGPLRDSRAEQCAVYDRRPFRGRFYTWVPYVDGDSPCTLNCRPRGQQFYASLALVTDGTPCTRPGYRAICVQGSCKVVFDNTRSVCHRCWQRAVNIEIPAAVPEVEVENAQELQVPDYTRAPNTPAHCLFNNCHNATRCRIPNTVKVYMLCEHKLYIPDGARVCRQHLGTNNWDQLPELCNVSNRFNALQFRDICDMLRTALREGPRLDFNLRHNLSEDEMHFWVGRSHEEFDLILEQTPSLSESCNEPRNALGIYLVKLRTGDSDDRLASLFNMSRRKLERLLAIVRECLTNEYVNLHLGVDHINRNDALNNNLNIPRALFGNEENYKMIIIADGTYIYINKSSNFLFQRQSYNLHKYKNLLKPFLLVCSNGYIIDVMGPYAATKTDANIMSDILTEGENQLHYFLQENDVFILDRGFRDSLGDIEACGYESYMPPTKDRRETQLTTEQANEARAVTLCRWVVEVVNGRFKRDYKLLRQTYFNKTLPKMFIDFKIAAAFLNHFHIPVVDNRHADAFLNTIREKIDSPNLLHNYVEAKGLNRRRVDFERIEANQIQNFPRLTEEQIILLSLGTYQLKLARSYCGEHLANGLYLIEVYRQNVLDDLPDYGIHENAWLLRGRIQSRHVRARTYYCYVLIKSILTDNNNILQYYCTCLTGRRTVGSCAHIISVVWYLGHARHEGFAARAAFLNDVIIDNNI